MRSLRLIIKILAISLGLVVILNFTITTHMIKNSNQIDIDKYQDRIVYNDDSFTILNCYELSLVEQIEIIKVASTDVTTKRTIKNMESELIFHVRMYKLGILKSNSKDATIDLNKDPRVLVRVITIIYQILCC